MMTYTRFVPAHRLAEYAGQSGPEVGGQRLTPAAYEAMSIAKASGNPPELVVVGEYVRDDGVRFLNFGVPTAYIEATTDYRFHKDHNSPGGRLMILCRDCGLWNGKHTKTCDR